MPDDTVLLFLHSIQMHISSLLPLKKPVTLLLLLMFIGRTAKAQPTYIEVLSYFFKHYSYEQSDLLEFAKKKDGWYVYTRNAEPPYLPRNMQLLCQNSTGKF